MYTLWCCLKCGIFSSFSSYWNKLSFSYTFLWAYGISAIKSTCSHFVVHLVLSRLGKIFEFSLKWKCEWLLSNKKTHFLVTLEHFFIFLGSNLGSMLEQLTWHSFVSEKLILPPLFLTSESYNMSKSCAMLVYRQNKPIQLRTCYWKREEKEEICNISTLKSRELTKNPPAVELNIT